MYTFKNVFKIISKEPMLCVWKVKYIYIYKYV